VKPLRAWTARLRDTLRPSRREREMADEFASHLALHVDDNIRAGMSPAEARRQALLKFGPMEAVKDAYRDRARFALAGRIGQDLRFALRLLRRAPAFSLAAIVTIALAIGVNAAMFSVLNAAALQPLRLPEAARLTRVSIGIDGPVRRGVSGVASMLALPEYETVAAEAHAFESVMAYAPFQPVTLGGIEPRPVLATLASCTYFEVLRVRPALGRALAPADCRPGADAQVAVLSDALWRSAFAADPAVVGRAVTLNRIPFTVIGVSPPGFTGTEVVAEDLVVALPAQPALERERDLLRAADVSWLMVIGRLRPDATLAQARRDLALTAGRLTAAAPAGRIIRLDAATATLSSLPEARRLVLAIGTVVLTAVALVLLIACANIANLLLARAVTRRREIAVRMALGAGRTRLIQQLLTESLLLAGIGGICGVAVGSWASRVVVAFVIARLPPGVWPLIFEPRADIRVGLYAAALTTLTGLAFGLAPALQSTRRDLAADFRDGSGAGARGGRLRGMLVSLQVAVCLVLLLSAGLLTRGLYRAQTLDPGLAMDGVSVVSYDLPGAGYTLPAAAAFQRQTIERLAALPGVRAVAQSSAAPLSTQHAETRFDLGEGRSRYLEFSVVSPGYFDVLHIPIVRGRTFTAAETQSEGAAIVTESTARRLWPGADPLAQSLVLDKVPRPIVGVVRDAQVSRLGFSDDTYVFLPAGPDSQQRLQLLVAGTGPVPGAAAIRAAVSAGDPQLATTVAGLSENLEQWRAPSRLVASLSSALAALALILACTGVFGTVAYAVSRRVREIGIRVALGAGRADVLRLILRQGMRPVLIGIGLGLAGAAATSTLFSSMLFGLSPYDPLAFIAVPAALTGVALLAGYVPARRALRVAPTEALKAE